MSDGVTVRLGLLTRSVGRHADRGRVGSIGATGRWSGHRQSDGDRMSEVGIAIGLAFGLLGTGRGRHGFATRLMGSNFATRLMGLSRD